MALMCSPAELGRLRAFADEAVDRPGVDEFARVFRDRRDLRIALRDMDHLDAEPLCEARPTVARNRNARTKAGILGQIDQRLLDEMRDQSRIGSMGQDGGRATKIAWPERQRALT